MVDVDDVAPGVEEIDGLAIEPSSLVDVAHLARTVQERVDLLIAGERRVQASLAGLNLVDVAVGIDAAAPADLKRLVPLAILVVRQGRGDSWARSEMLKPASRAICWMTSPTRRSRGLLTIVISKL